VEAEEQVMLEVVDLKVELAELVELFLLVALVLVQHMLIQSVVAVTVDLVEVVKEALEMLVKLQT
jgi:hypothetical protein